MYACSTTITWSTVLRNEFPTSGQKRTVKVGYEEGHSLAGRKNKPTPRKEIIISMQVLVLLVPNDKVELLRISTNYDFGLPGACCPRLPLDTAEQDNFESRHCTLITSAELGDSQTGQKELGPLL